MNQLAFAGKALRIGLASAGLFAISLSAGFSCSKEDPIRVYDVRPKDTDAGTVAANEIMENPIDWTLPVGWTKEPPRNIVLAAFNIDPSDAKSECTVSKLPAGQSFLANVNRWEGQLKLPPSSEESLKNILKQEDLPAGPATRIDLIAAAPATEDASPRQRIIAVILPHEQDWWFLKLVGRSDILDKQLGAFDSFLKSVHFSASGAVASGNTPSAPALDPGATPPADGIHGGIGAGPDTTQPADGGAPAAPPQKLTVWSTPAGWTQDPLPTDPNSLRRLSFHVAIGDKPATVTVTRLGGMSMEQLLGDINMWRDQVGLAALPELKNGEGTPLPIKNRLGMLFDYAGPQDKPDKRVVVALVLVGEDGWFFKIVGPADLVAAQKPAFLDFIKSAEFGPQ